MEYTDATFTTKMLRAPEEQHLGILGKSDWARVACYSSVRESGRGSIQILYFSRSTTASIKYTSTWKSCIKNPSWVKVHVCEFNQENILKVIKVKVLSAVSCDCYRKMPTNQPKKLYKQKIYIYLQDMLLLFWMNVSLGDNDIMPQQVIMKSK